MPGDTDRIHDLVYDKGGVPTYMEIKTGYVSLTKAIKRQILKDKKLMAGMKIEWRFYPGRTGKKGISKPLQDFLEGLDIPFETFY